MGTRLTEKSISAGYYYLGLGPKNAFWHIISYCFGDNDFESNNVEKIQEALKRHNLVVSDFIHSCFFKWDSSDTNIIRGTEIINSDLARLIFESDLVVLNGGNNKHKTGTLDYLNKYFDCESTILTQQKEKGINDYGYIRLNGKLIKYVSLFSSSGANTHMSVDGKKHIWMKTICTYAK